MEEFNWSVTLGHGLGGIELGVTRKVVLERLATAEHELEADDDEPAYVSLLDSDIELYFQDSQGAEMVLVQIGVEDNSVRFGSEPVIGRRLHEITALLQVNAAETVWRMDDHPEDSLPSMQTAQEASATDRDLMVRGTLWIRPLGIGLKLWQGEIEEVLIRKPEWTPEHGFGQLTPIQLELSKQEDLPTELHRPFESAARARRIFRFVSGAIFFALISLVVLQAAQYQRRWQDAPKAEGEVIAVGPGGPDTIATEFTVAYQDQEGARRQVKLGIADVYVPKAVGDRVELRYLPEAPDKPLGPGRVHDAAFVKYFPWGIGILAGYLVVQIAGAILLRLFVTPTDGLYTVNRLS